MSTYSEAQWLAENEAVEMDAAVTVSEKLWDGVDHPQLLTLVQEAIEQGASSRFQMVAHVDAALGRLLGEAMQ